MDTNITGTLNLLEEAAAVGIGSFIFRYVFGERSIFQVAQFPSPQWDVLSLTAE